MSWLILNADGTIASVLSDEPSAQDVLSEDGAGIVVERDIPADYPERASWDALALAFVADAEKAMAPIRIERDALLRACDWTQLSDVPVVTRSAWQVYRQALRDLPQTVDPFDPQWPVPPA